MIRIGATILALFASQTQAAEFYFCWTGANGYTMTGQMTIPDSALGQPMIDEMDVTRFKIAGYQEGTLLGKWDMAQRTASTSWMLRYDPQREVFVTPSDLGLGVTQAWNAGGDADDCGNPGFGFNLGNYAQDFCLNGVWIEQSGMPPDTPFLVSPVPIDPYCRTYAPVS